MKNFHFDGPTWAFLTPEQMYDEEGKLRRTHKHYQNADIYFITKMKKCLFNPSKTKVSMDGSINCEILLGDPENKRYDKISVSYPLSEILYSMPSNKAHFGNRDNFLLHILINRYQPKSKIKRSIYKTTKILTQNSYLPLSISKKILIAIYSSDIRVKHDSRYEINIFDPLCEFIIDDEKAKKSKASYPELYQLNDADWDIDKKNEIDFSKLPGSGLEQTHRLKIDQVINHFDIDIGGQNIAYIGKTEKEPFDRLFPHTKLNELNGKLSVNEFESLVIHLLGFMCWDEPINSLPPRTSLSKSDTITVAEAELINYFKPEENDDYVQDKGKPNWKHIKLLTKKGYRKIRGLLDIDGPYARFYTQHLGKTGKNRHEIDVDLNLYKSTKPPRKRVI